MYDENYFVANEYFSLVFFVPFSELLSPSLSEIKGKEIPRTKRALAVGVLPVPARDLL